MSLRSLCSFAATALPGFSAYSAYFAVRFRILRLAWFVDACSLQLFDSKSLLLQRLHHAVLAHEMRHADDDKNNLFAAQ